MQNWVKIVMLIENFSDLQFNEFLQTYMVNENSIVHIDHSAWLGKT